MHRLAAYVLLGLTGCASHYIYALCGKRKWLAPFFPVNESVWEHTKLICFPALAVSLIEYLICPEWVCWPGRFLGVICGVIFMVAGYYTYSGVIGKGILWADILLFYFSAAVFYLTAALCPQSSVWGYLLAGLVLMMFVFTFRPPHLPLFKDHRTGKYGAE